MYFLCNFATYATSANTLTSLLALRFGRLAFTCQPNTIVKGYPMQSVCEWVLSVRDWAQIVTCSPQQQPQHTNSCSHHRDPNTHKATEKQCFGTWIHDHCQTTANVQSPQTEKQYQAYTVYPCFWNIFPVCHPGNIRIKDFTNNVDRWLIQ